MYAKYFHVIFFCPYVTFVTHSFIFVSAVRVAGSVFPRMVTLQMLEVTPQVTCHPFEIKAQCGDHFHGNHSSMTILQESVRTPSPDASGKNKIKSRWFSSDCTMDSSKSDVFFFHGDTECFIYYQKQNIAPSWYTLIAVKNSSIIFIIIKIQHHLQNLQNPASPSKLSQFQHHLHNHQNPASSLKASKPNIIFKSIKKFSIIFKIIKNICITFKIIKIQHHLQNLQNSSIIIKIKVVVCRCLL